MPFLCLLAILLFSVPVAAQITLNPIAVFSAGGNAATEIAAYDKVTKRIFSVNGSGVRRVDVVDISTVNSQPNLPLLFSIPVGGQPNSVDVCDGVVAVAVEATPRTDPGKLEFFKTDGSALGNVSVGAVPDMVTFTPDCRYVLVANEGEPNSYNQPDSVDPEGSVSVIDLKHGVSKAIVRTARFHDRIFTINRESIRVFGPNSSLAQDLEPEYIAVSDDSKFAWVTLQEANAIATLDIDDAKFVLLTGLGFKDHSLAGNQLDPSDRDGPSNGPAIHIGQWPALGMYQPDSIAFFKVGFVPFLLVANEGDARDYTGFSEEVRVSAASLDPTAFPNGADLKNAAKLGRLTVTRTGDVDSDGDLDFIMPFGGRSFSVRNVLGGMFWDSGDDLEQKTALVTPASFNSDGTSATFDTRSDNKGPEPEALTVGKISGRTYAFVGLERTGGIMVYDVTFPWAPQFVLYANTNGDIAPEGLVFISAGDSPNGKPLLVVANEVSGTVRIYEINKN
jgi:hypothetical protein